MKSLLIFISWGMAILVINLFHNTVLSIITVAMFTLASIGMLVGDKK